LSTQTQVAKHPIEPLGDTLDYQVAIRFLWFLLLFKTSLSHQIIAYSVNSITTSFTFFSPSIIGGNQRST